MRSCAARKALLLDDGRGLLAFHNVDAASSPDAEISQSRNELGPGAQSGVNSRGTGGVTYARKWFLIATATQMS